MRHGIPSFRPRQPLDRQLTSDTLNRILSELESLRIVSVVNGTFRKLPGGTEINVAPQRGGAGAPTEAHPVKIASSGESVTIQPGTINNLLPTNACTDNALTALSLTPDALTFVILRAVSADGAMTSCSLLTSTTAPTSQTPTIFSLPTTYDVLLGIVYNSTVRQVVSTNLSVAGRQMFVTDRDVTTPGQLPYDVYFVWG
jgi:hypothetical protein